MASVSWHLQPPLFPLAERHVQSGELHGVVQWGLRTLSNGPQLAFPFDQTLLCATDTRGGVAGR